MATRSDNNSDYSPDDESVMIDIDDDHISTNTPGGEEEFDNECGYFLVKMLRGNTLGRQIKREVFKLSIFEIIYGIAIFLISCYESVTFGSLDGYFTGSKYGGSILGMQMVCSIGSILFSIFSWLSMKYWSSLVTNRELLASILKLYQFLLIIHFAICLWSLNALFATFENTDWQVLFVF